MPDLEPTFYDMTEFRLDDPDGNMIEVSAWLVIVHDRPVKEWKHEPYTLNMWGPAIMRS